MIFLEALSIEKAESVPSLFSFLLAYLQGITVSTEAYESYKRNYCEECIKEIKYQLYVYMTGKNSLKILTANNSFDGYVLKIVDNILYIADDLTNITDITAIPICKIISIQPQ